VDAFLGFLNRIAKAIGITRDEQFFPLNPIRETSPPRVFTREPIANQPGEKRFSFFAFLSFFSTASEKPVSQPSASMPSYKAPPSDASIRLPYYARNNFPGNITSYFKDNNISSIDLASLGLAESPLMTAARKGNVEAVSSFLPYATLKNIDIYHAYNLLKIDLTVQEVRDPISQCVKTAVAAGLPLWFAPARADGIGLSLSAP
jgi:hypothetical protein